MSSQSGSPDPWIGKLVWFFPRDDAGLPIGNSALCGIVIDKVQKGWYLIMYENDRVHAWVDDMEEMEDWDE